jgi:hypothetical protein
MIPVTGGACYLRSAVLAEQLDLVAIGLSVIVLVEERYIAALNVRLMEIQFGTRSERIIDVDRVMGSNICVDFAEIGRTRSRAAGVAGTAIDVSRMAAGSCGKQHG